MIRDARRVAEKVAEGMVIRCLRIRQTIPLLKDGEFDHEDDIIVRSTALSLIIRVHIRKERAEPALLSHRPEDRISSFVYIRNERAEGIPVDQG
jgi:hypothetical protein